MQSPSQGSSGAIRSPSSRVSLSSSAESSSADKWLQMANKIADKKKGDNILHIEADKYIVSEITAELRGLLVEIERTDWMYGDNKQHTGKPISGGRR